MITTKNKKNYSLSRIRLINFHNFVDELIEIRNGGHLFMLGDNGSGKTTIIDAIHYVLTAGDSMEFNSAARVAGSKSDGRRPQGIVSRYNVGAGHMNPDGAVTYAAVEICSENGKTSVIAIGMSINSPDDKLTRWGIVREGSLEDIPFMIDEPQGKRPRAKHEMQQALGNSGYFGQMHQYKKRIAERFIGGEESFSEFCSFLHMGKAYREIASNAADYHSLFKKLLPEKRIDLFETIISSLRTIDSDTGDLDTLRYKLNYIQELNDIVRQIDDISNQILCFKHHGIKTNIALLNQNLTKEASQKQTIENDLKHIHSQHAEKLKELKHQNHLLANLQAKDSGGLLEREKELNSDRDSQLLHLKTIDDQIKQQKSTLTRLNKSSTRQNEELQKHFSSQLNECSRLSPKLPFSLASYIQAMDFLVHADPVDSLEILPVDDMRNQAEDAQSQSIEQRVQLTSLLAEKQTEEKKLTAELEALRRQPEAKPSIPGFSEAETILQQAMITATPLYKALEWAASTTAPQRSHIEELIGDHVLCTFIIRETDWDRACKAILPRIPNIRLAKHRDPKPGEPIADWIRTGFDLSTSDPAAILVLNDEMIANQPPAFNSTDTHTALTFRAHQRALSEEPARFIGNEARQMLLKRQIKQTEQNLTACRRELTDLSRQLATVESTIEAIHNFRELFRNGLDHMRDCFNTLSSLRQQLDHETGNLNTLTTQADGTQKTIANLTERINAIRQNIDAQGLKKLDAKLRSCRNKINSCNFFIEEINRKAGAIEQQLTDIQNRENENRTLLAEASERLENTWNELAAKLGQEKVADYLESTEKDWSYSTMKQLQDLYDETKNRYHELQVKIEERMKNLEYGAFYGFTYDRTENRLFDRHQCDIAELVSSLRKSIAEQEEIINEKTTELFRNVIQDSLVHFIISNITRLRDMIKDINRLLSNRSFGMNRYRIQLTPLKENERFLKTFENYNAFNETSENDLRELLDDYREDILSTEVNAIPAVLDYRNWFSYEMKVTSGTENEDGDVITRRLKGLGSGGEQAVPNYLLILTIAHFLYRRSKIRLHVMLFDEAFYGIDEERRNQLMGFATDLGLQLFVASPDQDGVRKEIAYATSLLVLKDINFDVHLYSNHFENPTLAKQLNLFADEPVQTLEFGEELAPETTTATADTTVLQS